MKKISSILLSLSLLLGLAMPSFAAGDSQISIDADVSAVSEGDTFSVLVNIENNPGFDSIQIDVNYDEDSLVCLDANAGKVLASSNALFADNIDRAGVATFAAITISTISDSGCLAELTFRALEGGNSEITVDLVYIDKAYQEFTLPVSQGVTVNVDSNDEPIVPETPEQPEEPEIPEIPEEKPEIEVSFSDVPKTHWAYTYVQNAVKNGLFSGIGNGMFGPSMNVTRGMFVTTLYSSAGSPDVELSSFTDVPSNAWYAKAVAWASQQGIVSGIGDNKFGPDLPITREQIALILFNYADGVSPGTEAFVRAAYPDGKDIHNWALTAFTWAMNKELISGKSGNILDPLATATRAEVAVIMQNFVNLTK